MNKAEQRKWNINPLLIPRRYIVNDGKRRVAILDTSHPDVEDNAALIEAAPDLLDALEELADIIEHSPEDIDSFTTQPARAAIEKATVKR